MIFIIRNNIEGSYEKFKPILRCVIFLTGLIVIMGVIDFACVQTGYVNYILRNVCVKIIKLITILS